MFSAAANTLDEDEEHRLWNCLESLEWADEVAGSFGDRVLLHERLGYQN